MSNRRKRPKVPTWRNQALLATLGEAPPSDPLAQLEAIYDDAPDRSFLGDEKIAVWSATCCWWSSNPHTVGQSPKHKLPACPSCGSVLYQGPLRHFIDRSSEHPDAYGEGGMAAFVAAHNTTPCHQSWDEYVSSQPQGEDEVAPFDQTEFDRVRDALWTEGDLPGYEAEESAP